MTVHISKGNRRMDIPLFNLPSKLSCPGSTPHCRKYCYAQKAEKAWPQVLPSRMRNYEASLESDFVDIMIAKIRKLPDKFFRIHESGDMYNQRYLEKWFRIVRNVSTKTFIAYTQSFHLDWSEKPSNLIVYWSVWDDSKNVPKTGLHAYCIDNGKGYLAKYTVPNTAKVCRKGKGSKLKCNDCLYCYEGRGDVVFELH